ncbi:hypothetical protein Hanom_Chr12g01101981 [Helianthus anomalus]
MNNGLLVSFFSIIGKFGCVILQVQIVFNNIRSHYLRFLNLIFFFDMLLLVFRNRLTFYRFCNFKRCF